VSENRRIERVRFYVWLCPDILQVSQHALELKGKPFPLYSICSGLVLRNKELWQCNWEYGKNRRSFFLL